MAYTSADRDGVQAAILALAKGERATSVTFADGRRVDYAETDLAALRSLLASIDGEIASAAGSRVRVVRFDTARGL